VGAVQNGQDLLARPKQASQLGCLSDCYTVLTEPHRMLTALLSTGMAMASAFDSPALAAISVVRRSNVAGTRLADPQLHSNDEEGPTGERVIAARLHGDCGRSTLPCCRLQCSIAKSSDSEDAAFRRAAADNW